MGDMQNIVNDKSLSLEAKGLLFCLLSFGEDYKIFKKNLYSEFGQRRGTIDRVFKELQDNGYIISTKTSNGKAFEWVHTIRQEL